MPNNEVEAPERKCLCSRLEPSIYRHIDEGLHPECPVHITLSQWCSSDHSLCRYPKRCTCACHRADTLPAEHQRLRDAIVRAAETYIKDRSSVNLSNLFANVKDLWAAGASGDAAVGAGLSSRCETDSISVAALPARPDVEAAAREIASRYFVGDYPEKSAPKLAAIISKHCVSSGAAGEL